MVNLKPVSKKRKYPLVMMVIVIMTVTMMIKDTTMMNVETSKQHMERVP